MTQSCLTLCDPMGFLVVMCGCESLTLKKAEHRRIGAFEPWCWRRLLRFPWTERRSNQSILKKISPGYSLEGLMLKLKLQCFGYLSKSRLIRKDLDAGKDWRKEEKGTTEDEMIGWHHCVSGHEFEQVPGDDEGQKSLVAAVHGVTKSWTWLSNWTTTWTVAHQTTLSVRFHHNHTGVGCHFLLQQIFPTQGSTPCLLCLLHG